MKCPNRLPIVIGGAVGAIVLALALVLPGMQEGPAPQDTHPTDPNIQIQVPAGPTDPTEVPPTVIIPDPDPTISVDPTVSSEPSAGDAVIEGEDETVIKDPVEDEEVPEDVVVDAGKKEDDEQHPGNDEVRNDAVLEEKEDATPDEEEQKDVIIVDEETIPGEGKGDVHVGEDEPNPDGDESNKNAPDYQPPAGGENPFDNDVETEIEDTPVEDLIGEGEDRPGEGTHF